MIDELNTAVMDYHAKWHALVAARTHKNFFEQLKPTAVAWKAEDIEDFNQRFMALRDLSDQVHLGWINERWLATFHLKAEHQLQGCVCVVKLMQRRPGSSDATGLDHLDFYQPDDADAGEVLASEPNLKWSEEKNGDHCKWLSIWFDGSEAKLRRDTVLNVCAQELKDTERDILEA